MNQKKLAEILHVSPSTVSKALSGSNEISQEKELIDDVFGKLYDEQNFNLVMIHRPQQYYQFNEYKIDLMLSIK